MSRALLILGLFSIILLPVFAQTPTPVNSGNLQNLLNSALNDSSNRETITDITGLTSEPRKNKSHLDNYTGTDTFNNLIKHGSSAQNNFYTLRNSLGRIQGLLGLGELSEKSAQELITNTERAQQSLSNLVDDLENYRNTLSTASQRLGQPGFFSPVKRRVKSSLDSGIIQLNQKIRDLQATEQLVNQAVQRGDHRQLAQNLLVKLPVQETPAPVVSQPTQPQPQQEAPSAPTPTTPPPSGTVQIRDSLEQIRNSALQSDFSGQRYAIFVNICDETGRCFTQSAIVEGATDPSQITMEQVQNAIAKERPGVQVNTGAAPTPLPSARDYIQGRITSNRNNINSIKNHRPYYSGENLRPFYQAMVTNFEVLNRRLSACLQKDKDLDRIECALEEHGELRKVLGATDPKPTIDDESTYFNNLLDVLDERIKKMEEIKDNLRRSQLEAPTPRVETPAPAGVPQIRIRDPRLDKPAQERPQAEALPQCSPIGVLYTNPSWCIPCRQLDNALDRHNNRRVRELWERFIVEKTEREIPEGSQVTGIPSLVLGDGTVLTGVGPISSKLESAVNDYLEKLRDWERRQRLKSQ